MAIADVNDTQPSRRDQIVARFVERAAAISGMAGATGDAPYSSLARDKLPFTWIVDVEEDAEPFSSGLDLFTLSIVTWTAFSWEEDAGETVKTIGRRIYKALLIGCRSEADDETLGLDTNGAQLCLSIQPGQPIIEPSGESGNMGIVKVVWVVRYLCMISDPSAMGGN